MQKSKLQVKGQKFFSSSAKNTWELADKIFKNLAFLNRGRAVVLALKGELGAGKTTFAQGILRAAGAQGPFTSPTFVIMKAYRPSSKLKGESEKSIQKTTDCLLPATHFKNIFHIDAYRVESRDVLDLGWEEIISNPENLVLVEWPEKIKSILPSEYILIEFETRERDKREINLSIK